MFQLSYNIDIEIFALFLTILLYFEMRSHYPQDAYKNRVFSAMTLLVIFTELFDITSAFTNTPTYGEQIPRLLNLFINSAYFMLGLVLSYMLHYYIQITFVPQNGKTVFLKANRWILLLTELSFIPNIWYGYYFFISSEGYYVHGPLYLLQHLISFWLVLCASLTLIVNYKIIKKERILSGILFIFIYLVSLFLQTVLFPNIFLIMPAVSIMLVLAVFSLESPDYRQLQKTLQEISQITLELEDANRKLKNQAYTDIMTGLKNRTAYNLRLDEINSFVNPGKIIFLIADINGLKELNDNYGHLIGDDAIVRTARLLKEAFGRNCECYRIGGDEFAVIANELSQDEFSKCYEHFEEAMRLEQENVTYSFSVAAGYQAVEQSTLVEAMKKADKNMYMDKMNKKAGM